MTRVAILAAFPDELKPLVKGWPHSVRAGIHFWAQRNEEEEWIAACAGAGQPAVTRAFAALEDGGPIDLVFSIGWAGALREDLTPGAAYNVGGVIDSRTGERIRCDAEAGSLWLVTSPRVADEREKLRLASTYNAALVDMEAAAVARLATMRGIPFYAIKGISDSLHAKLPDFNRFITPGGRMLIGKLILHVLPRPWYWPSLLQMGENSKKAARSMAETLHSFLAEQDNSQVT